MLSHDLLIVCNPNVCLPIQMQDSDKDNVTSDNIYSPPPALHTHEKQQSQFMLACSCDHGEISNIQGGGRKFLVHLIRHCRSRVSSESSKQGRTMRINQTISTKIEFYSIFVSFIVRRGGLSLIHI